MPPSGKGSSLARQHEWVIASPRIGCRVRLAAAIARIDGFVFTAGTGQNASATRRRIAQRMAWFGVALDTAAGERGSRRMFAARSAVVCHVALTAEEMMIGCYTPEPRGRSNARITGAMLARKARATRKNEN